MELHGLMEFLGFCAVLIIWLAYVYLSGVQQDHEARLNILEGKKPLDRWGFDKPSPKEVYISPIEISDNDTKDVDIEET